MENSERRMFLLGAVAIGLTLLVSLTYSLFYYGAYTRTTEQALQLQDRIGDVATIRGNLNAVIAAFSDPLPSGNPSMAIEQQVSKLQIAWSEIRNDPQPGPAAVNHLMPAGLNASIRQFALTALRGSTTRGESQKESLIDMNAVISSQLNAVEDRISESTRSVTVVRISATGHIDYGERIFNVAFACFLSLIGTALFVSGAKKVQQRHAAWISSKADALLTPSRVD